jgi:hypothetical protein
MATSYRRGLISVPIRQEMRPANARYINSLDGSIVLMKFSTMDSAGADIYLAATEDTMISAKTPDQMIMLENCFMKTFLLDTPLLFVQIYKST